MKRYEVLESLDSITGMTDEDIKINPVFIRETAIAAYSLIKQKYQVAKQIPQKVVKIEGVSSQACPVCKSNVNGKYCSYCGQRLSYGL
ncbi:hypothetical protein ACFSMW_13360 [Virgibacillus halophilus]|uniref:Zinc ribbon domain-containing protein n=1 Tax=Tigheibacillus halophilus TaxID=361280 RepID=A0ABU5C7V3_9BACI|nr:hypothetical protein [Virgibacillus halophilus]